MSVVGGGFATREDVDRLRFEVAGLRVDVRRIGTVAASLGDMLREERKRSLRLAEELSALSVDGVE